MPLCSVPNCNERGVHLFPKDKKMKKLWERVIRRKNFVATKYSRLCRNHFKDSDYQGESIYTGKLQQRRYLKKDVVPSVFPWTQENCTPTVRALRYEQKIKRRFDFSSSTAVAISEESSEDSKVNEFIVPEVGNEVELQDIPSVPSPDKSTERCLRSMATQTIFKENCLSIEKLKGDHKALHYYTGLENYDKFIFVYQTLTPMCYNLRYRESTVINISTIDQFLITLIKLRLNKPNFELAFLFGTSQSNVSNIFVTWINFIYEIWSCIDIWPDRSLVEYYMPQSFKKDFKSTRVIIDTTEIPIDKPGNPVAQQATFSTYKNRNTLKVMIGATPSGLISYVSETYGGAVSDRQIIERSKLLDMCQGGDSIMADRGFNVQDIFANKNIKVNIPAFLKGKSQLPGLQVVKDRKLASKRVHIERIIGLAKTFKILKGELDSHYVPLGSRIIFICAMLCNFRETIM